MTMDAASSARIKRASSSLSRSDETVKKRIPIPSAAKCPHSNSAGRSNGSPSGPGRSNAKADISAAQTMARIATLTEKRRLRLVAATVTGASRNSRNGLARPPVSASSKASCSVSKPSCRTASQPFNSNWSRMAKDMKTLSQAEAAITVRQRPSGNSNPRPKCTNSTAAVCPATASQRSVTSVRRRARPRAASTPARPVGRRL